MDRRKFLLLTGGSLTALSGCLGDGDDDSPDETPTSTPSSDATATPTTGETPTPDGTPDGNPTPVGGTPENATDAGRRLLQSLRSGAYEDGYSLFLSQIQERISPGQLEALWIAFTNVGGSYQELSNVSEITTSGFEGVDLTLAFERGTHTLRVLTDQNRDYAIVTAIIDDEYSSPDYVDSEAFLSQETAVETDDCELGAAVTVPSGPDSAPGVVLVHGSDVAGDADRNLTNGGSQPFRDLAEGLASQGVAVLRYDRRTNACPDSLSPQTHTLNEVAVNDTLAAIETLRGVSGVDSDRIVVVGHELGGRATPRIAKRDGNLAGIVPMAAPARPYFELFPDQYEHLASVGDLKWGRMATLAQKWNERMETIRNVDFKPDDVILRYPGSLFLSIAAYKHFETARGLDLPMLFLQGLRDYEVSPEKDFQLWQDELSDSDNATFQSYEGLNHVFQFGEGPSVPIEYAMSNPVDGNIVSDIADWVGER